MPKATKDKVVPPSLWRTDTTHISVRTKHGDRWRAQRKFTATPVVIAKDELSEDETLLIQRDDLLAVEEVDAPA